MGSAAAGGAGRLLSLRFLFLEIVGDAEAHAGGVVHLARRLLGVLELGETVLDLRELFQDQRFEVVDLPLRDRERVFVELLLLRRKAHAPLPPWSPRGDGLRGFAGRSLTFDGARNPTPVQGLTSTTTVRHILTGTPFFV